MKALLCFAALLVSASLHAQTPNIATTEPAKPVRVVSLSLCMDELLISLAEREQIAAVSRLAQDPLYSVHWQTAQSLPRHSGLAEQIVALNPDLILGAEYEQGKAVQMLRKLGYSVQTFSSPTTLAEIPAQIQAVAAALGATERAAHVLAEMEHDFAAARMLAQKHPRLLALSLAPNGYVNGTQSLKNELLHLAGYQTVADQLGLAYDTELKLEQLLLSQPERIFLEEQAGNRHSLAHRLLQHPALTGSAFSTRTIAFPSQYWLCPGPHVAKAARLLAEAQR